MLRHLLLTFGIILLASISVFSQSGSGALKGKVIDKDTKEPLAFANIILDNGGTQVGGTTSDFDGNYTIKPVPPGKYTLKATYMGYKTVVTNDVRINSDQITFYDVKMESSATNLEEIVVTDYKVPLIDKDKTVSGGHITAEEIKKMPNRSAGAIAATVGGVYSADGGVSNVRGARSDGTIMYIDGMRVLGSAGVPQQAIEEVSVYLGGLPAMYGDARGGIINVTTKGPSRTFGGGLEFETSQFLDAFGHNRLGFSLQGPLIKGKEGQTSLLGYFISGDLFYNKDGRPTAYGVYVANDDYLAGLEENPLRPSGQASGTFLNAEYTRSSDLQHQKYTPNSSRYGANLSGKIDVRTSKNTTLTIGGQYNFNQGHNFSLYNSMFNYNKNAVSYGDTWRVYGRFIQRFPADPESKSLIKNVYYSIQGDYTQTNGRTMDPDHRDNIFQIGYLGSFGTYKTPTYELGNVDVDGQHYENVWVLNSWDFDTLLTFKKENYNPLIANYNRQIYELFPEGFQNTTQLLSSGGRLNGQGPPGVYGLWGSPGGNQASYSVGRSTQVSFKVDVSADVGNNELKLGFQYEQRSSSGYGYNGNGLWTLMRSYTNLHILELDKDNPVPVYNDGVFQDTVLYYRKYDQPTQTTFDWNLRNKLGLDPQGTDFIIIDSWDFDAKTIQYYDKDGVLHTKDVGGDLFSIDMFNADELLFDGRYVASYYGYDYKGNKLKTKPSFNDFFTEKDEYGNYTRPIPAYEPIYMAGYIQDKFAFKDLVFNVGLRVDRFDANQSVLKDPFLFYPAYSVGETKQIGVGGNQVSIPGNMGDDYVVYVDDARNPSAITGYRKDYTWYNAEGIEIQDPYVLDAGAGVSPYLVDPSQEHIDGRAFKDYDPQWSVMPRISFSFPISDEALFFAHYDVLTQRPTSNVYADPSRYYFINTSGGSLNNPSLKPTKRIDYELGFQQKLSNKSSLKLTVFYGEIRDDIQIYRLNGAYPRTYDSFKNHDFSTVKGLTATYDLRQLNSNTRLNFSYTLQFADGTGSSTTTSAALVASGLPNLRVLNPLNWDRRHNFTMLLEYRFADGKAYNGPTITRHKGTDQEKTVQVLKNLGANFTLTGGSGVPYTAQENITGLTTGGTKILEGTINGSRLPWQFRVDMRIDKEIYFGGQEGKKRTYLDIYLQILNLFNTHNIMAVYPATGNPDDDGYLSAPEWQTQINNQTDPQSFRDLYSVRVNSPYNYSSPRMIRLGLMINF